MHTHSDNHAARCPAVQLAVAVLLLLLALTGCRPATANTTASSATTAPTAHALPARQQLAHLVVRVEDTGAHYRRQQWGHWTAAPGGCDTRDLVLVRDAHTITGRRGCQPTAGTWMSRYDGLRVTDPAAVQIDHRVPLREATRSGARTWDRATRVGFYNDPANLVAVSAHANTSKGDRDPGTWRPGLRTAWCDYASAYIATKHTYRLSVDARERAGLASMLNTCPDGGGLR